MFGGSGNDTVIGGNGRDFLYGESGNDTLIDTSGPTTMRGGPGNDTLRGSNNGNSLFGDSGNDVLIGGSARDLIYGGTGSDTLIGGSVDTNDRLDGESGVDHILYRPQNQVVRRSGDINVKFVNGNSVWSTSEMLVVDRAIQKLHAATSNNRLLVDALTGDDLEFQKVRSLAGGAAALNELKYTSSNGVRTYERVIRFADWNEANEPLNGSRVLATVHEIAHNFDHDFEYAAAGLPFLGLAAIRR